MATLLSDIKSSDWQISFEGAGKIVEGISDINQCIFIILTTKKGTDALRPEFGCDVYSYIDKPLNLVKASMIFVVIAALKKYEPRIKVTKVTPTYDSTGFLEVKIEWTYLNAVQTNQTTVNYGIAA